MEPVLWSIKYRPKQWDDFFGIELTLQHLKNLAESSTCPNIILYGSEGTGKTAASKVFVKSFLGDDVSTNYLRLNIRDITSYNISDAKRDVKALAKLDRSDRMPLDEYMSIIYKQAKASLKTRGISRRPSKKQLLQEAISYFASTYTVTDTKVKILVLDEADALSYSMQQALRRTMEIYNEVCRFILITPTLAGWSPAIISRCVTIHFPSASDAVAKSLIHHIANNEGLEIENPALEALVRQADGNLRKAIHILQIAATGSKKITEDTIYSASETHLQKRIHEMVSFAIDGQHVKARKIMMRLLGYEQYSTDEVVSEMKEDLLKRPLSHSMLIEMIERLAEIDSRIGHGKNDFIHLSACFASFARIAKAHES
ncbi:MAG: AAA family ATPase [Candidatus Lokiarchaeota archaeon]|nr:AAA family ATPase [Candidatus Lokiarchaeota archaeon]